MPLEAKDYLGPAITALTALCAVMLTWKLNSGAAEQTRRRNAHADFLRTQLRELYGELAFRVTENELLVKHSAAIGEAADKAYSGEAAPNSNWSEEAWARRSKDIDSSIQVPNDYGKQMLENNAAIVALLRCNYHLLDPEDQVVCNDFMLDQRRLATETDASGKQRMGLDVVLKLPSTFYVRSEFTQSFKRAFEGKRVQLKAVTEESHSQRAWWDVRKGPRISAGPGQRQ